VSDATAILDEAALEEWGERVGRQSAAPLVLALRGDLGAGKSTLARAVARGAGIEGPVPSPTYNLLFHYDAPRGVRLVHTDLYRLEDPEEVWELGWAELPEDDQILMIEWPERAEALLPEPRWDLYIDEIADQSRRRIRRVAVGTPHALPPFPGDPSVDVT
jgi:tRNA threonylcarbamoyladenosine biosynthesis protein TsaE